MVLPPKPKSGSQISVPKKKLIAQSVSEIASPQSAVTVDASPAPNGVDVSSADGRDRSENLGQALVAGDKLPAAYSTPNLPLIPEQACHPFHTKAATDSRAMLPPWQIV